MARIQLKCVLIVGSLLAAAGCVEARPVSDSTRGADRTPDGNRSASGPCAWGVDELLDRAHAPAPARENCGHYDRNVTPLTAPFACFASAQARGLAVQLTVDDCCGLPKTYVATDTGQTFVAVHEDARLGRLDGQRLTRIGRCEAISLTEDGDIQCDHEEELYSCREPGSIEREALSEPPVQPLKLADPPSTDDEERRVFHLRVTNQSPDHPLALISVFIDGVHVVHGNFDFEWRNENEFDILLAVGQHRFRAVTQGDHSVQYEQLFDHTAASWATLAYDYQQGRWHEDGDAISASIPSMFILLIDDFCSFPSCRRR